MFTNIKKEQMQAKTIPSEKFFGSKNVLDDAHFRKGLSYSTPTACVKIWIRSVKPFLSQGAHKYKKRSHKTKVISLLSIYW